MTQVIAARVVGSRGRWATRQVAIQKVLKSRRKTEIILSNISPRDIKMTQQGGESLVDVSAMIPSDA